MITLRGKLIRSLVEAPPTKSITTRRNLPDNEAITMNNNDASSTAAAVTQSTENAPTSEEKHNETSTPPLVEEWLWRGVWAFGSLPEMDIDVLSGSSKPKEEEGAAVAPPKKENDEEGGNWIQKLTNRIISVSGENKEGEKSMEGVAAVDNTAAAAAADGVATDTTVKKTEEQTSPEQEGVPRPFCYRFIKCMDANDVVVPSSLLVVEEEVVPVADEEVKLVNEEENNSRKQPNDESNDEVKKDLTKSESAVNHLGDDDNNKEGEAADEKNAAPENNAESQKTDEAVKDKDLMMSSTPQATEGAKSEIASAATKVQDSLINDHDTAISETAKITTQGSENAAMPDQPQTTSIQTENSAQPTTTAAVPTTDDKSTTQPTPKPKINKQTYGQSPYTPANLTQPTPPGGKWEGHFENIVPNTSTTAAASKKRKDKRDNRIREVFYLFFNSTPPSDAKTAFAVEDTASTANDQLAEGQEGDATTTNKQENSLLLPEGRIHVRGYGTNRFGTFEIVGSLDVDTGILHCQRMYVETPPERDSRKPKRTASGQFSTTGRRGRPPKNKDGEGKRGRKRKPSLKKRTMDSFSSFDGVDAGPVAGAGGDIASSVKKRARLSVDSGGAGAPPSLPQCQSSSKSTPSLKGPVGKSSSKKKKLPPANKEAAISHIVQPIVDIVDPLPSDGDPLLARWRAAHYLYYQREEADPDDGEANTSTKIKSVVYEGEMVDGYRGGMGICLYNNDTMYEGQWKKNKEHGKGTLMTPDRSKIIYKGDWERGRMHGYGSYYYHKDLFYGEGGHYEGDFRENLRHGRGKYTFPDSSTYEGEWRENMPNGWGLFRWPDGSSLYEGFWKNGCRHGNSGTLIVEDGFRYEGAWVDNAMEGRGIATYPNGQVYEGMWVAGRREGRGTIRFTNGAVYEGRFKDDNMEGQGTMKMNSNAIIPPHSDEEDCENDNAAAKDGQPKNDWMIPIEFQSDISHIHQKAGFTQVGL